MLEDDRPTKKRKVGHKTETNSYPIDFIRYSSTHSDLIKLKGMNHILDDIHFIIPGKGDTHSRPPGDV